MVTIKPRIKIKIDETDLENRRNYAVTGEISLSILRRFQKPLQENDDAHLESVGGVGKLLLEEVFSLPGIVDVFIHPYSLNVIKGEAFNWEDIEPGIITALKRTFGPEAEQVEVVHAGEAEEEYQEEKLLKETSKKTVR